MLEEHQECWEHQACLVSVERLDQMEAWETRDLPDQLVYLELQDRTDSQEHQERRDQLEEKESVETVE